MKDYFGFYLCQSHIIFLIKPKISIFHIVIIIICSPICYVNKSVVLHHWLLPLWKQ